MIAVNQWEAMYAQRCADKVVRSLITSKQQIRSTVDWTLNNTTKTSVQAVEASSTSTQQIPGDLAFLVTHWLSGYSKINNDNNRNAAAAATNAIEREQQEEEEALRTIHKAAADLAAAFTTLDVFGKRNNNTNKNTSFVDMKRTWSSPSHRCPFEHLQHILQACNSTATVVDRSVQRNAPENHMQVAEETIARASLVHTATHPGPEGGTGRTLQDAIVVVDDGDSASQSDRS